MLSQHAWCISYFRLFVYLKNITAHIAAMHKTVFQSYKFTHIYKVLLYYNSPGVFIFYATINKSLVKFGEHYLSKQEFKFKAKDILDFQLFWIRSQSITLVNRGAVTFITGLSEVSPHPK